jgi:hypothetical protein
MSRKGRTEKSIKYFMAHSMIAKNINLRSKIIGVLMMGSM